MVEADLKRIRRYIFLSMNGIAAENMETAGVHYRQNYGLQLPQIKDIASRFAPDVLLAERLWSMRVREMMILATMLLPPAEFSETIAKRWIREIETMEVAQQLSFNLLVKCNLSIDVVKANIFSDRKYSRIVGLLAASRMVERFSDEDLQGIADWIVPLVKSSDFELINSMSVFLRFLCRKDNAGAHFVLSKINGFKNSDFRGERYIFEEITNEVHFWYA